MYLLRNSIQPYAWGSTTHLAELTGRAPDGTPEAELWMGAHPIAPSRAVVEEGDIKGLDELISDDPEASLGGAVVARFGPHLPFLMKVLAAHRPLSLQAHPSLEQAQSGFDCEEREGIPRNAPQRNYKDRNHKPELLCALTRFEALCGFRAREQSLALVQALGVGELREAAAPLRRAGNDARAIRATYETLMTLGEPVKANLLRATIQACESHATSGRPFANDAAWAVKLGEYYPGDIGAIVALLLELVVLEPGEAVYLPAGNLHAYLGGAGVEIMASSDNVLRGGLTPKHVDVPELLRVVRFEPTSIPRVTPRRVSPQEELYDTPAPDFRLSRVKVDPAHEFHATPTGPEILLVTEGALLASAEGKRVPLERGGSLFLRVSGGAYALRGEAVVYRARVGLD